MKTKIALLLAIDLLLTGVESRADVVGLNTTTTTTITGPAEFGNGANFLSVNFSTTGNSTNKFTAVKFNNLGIVSLNFSVSLYKGGTIVSGSTDNLTYSTPGAAINFNNVANTTWDASSSYELRFTINQEGGASFSNYTKAVGPDVTNSITDWIVSGSQNQTAASFPSGPAFTLYAAIPEPSTMILTGSALAAGAVGGFFKRRRKIALETTVS